MHINPNLSYSWFVLGLHLATCGMFYHLFTAVMHLPLDHEIREMLFDICFCCSEPWIFFLVVSLLAIYLVIFVPPEIFHCVLLFHERSHYMSIHS